MANASLSVDILHEELTAIRVRGARTHNLKNVDIELPHEKLIVITGVSGSGKSSLAFDTIYAEGQRQYIDSLSVYARQFIDQLQRPDVDGIEGLQPTLCIDQRAGAGNPRSTVATVTEIYDYLRLLMARVGTPSCYSCGRPILQQSPDQIQSALLALPIGTRLIVMAPVVRGRRGHHREAITAIRRAGLLRARVDGELVDIESVPKLNVRGNHTIEAIVDKIVLREEAAHRLAESIQLALRLADGLVSVSYLTEQAAQRAGDDRWSEQLFSTRYACPDCGISYEEVEPRTFSFNSPYGACADCEGIGSRSQLDPELVIPEWNKSPRSGAIAAWRVAPATIKRALRKEIELLLAPLGGSWDQTLADLKPLARRKLLEGDTRQTGLLGVLDRLREPSDGGNEWLDVFRQTLPCPTCKGARLRKEALAIRLMDRNIHELCSRSIGELQGWFEQIRFTGAQALIANPVIAGILHRLRFLNRVGVSYLTLDRSADTLSGGELQRVRLATSIGSGLVGVCYVLDEPSIGLHQRDNDRLIESLRNLQQQGNTVIVVEHDEAMMRASDMLIDVGPGAGERGGEIVACGPPAELAMHPTSITAAYLRRQAKVGLPGKRRSINGRKLLKLQGASLHNLQSVSVTIPLGCLVGITGVSGSGKSSLICETLAPALAQALGQSTARPGPYKKLTGVEHVDKLIEISQDPIGRSPRSTPATYCGVFDFIRSVFAGTREAKQRGFSAARFSFNTGDGRCAQCQGQGVEKIEMNFLADLYVTCSACNGSRYNRQTLQARYRDKSIADVLSMSIDAATEFFANFSKIHRILNSMCQVGLGYLSLGQNSTTLSGGEAQRIKLATELARAETGRTVYFLDEPTTGLHFDDVNRLLGVLDGLVERGNTVIVIEHNMDVIRACDWLVDLGPGGGSEGGKIVAEGSPEEIANFDQSVTGAYLKSTV